MEEKSSKLRLSSSKIKAFKACRRMYELRYIHHLEPVQKSEALETGTNYHKLLEDLNNGKPIKGNPEYEGNYSKELAMAMAYEKYIYPKFHVVKAEEWLTYDLGDNAYLVGIADGIADDGHIVEHKSCGSEITEQYEYNLLWDEQILAYMLMTGMRKVWYTVCRKPTIRQKQNESEEEFFNRMVEWYDTDTDSKIRLLEIERTDEEVKAYLNDLNKLSVMMNRKKPNYYRNTCHCNMYGKRCEYSSICLNYDPEQEYIDFVKVKEKENPNETKKD